MRRLPMPDGARSRDDLVRAVRPFTKGGTAYGIAPADDEIDAIMALYDDYDAAGGHAVGSDSSTGLSNALTASIRHAFTRTHSTVLGDLRAALLDPSSLCPICGIGWCEELDHFLPKADYGVFAIYVRNLIPLCHTCNNTKRESTGTTPADQFVHAYFDDIPDTAFIRANVRLQGPTLQISFGIDPAAQLSDAFAARLTFQLNRLGLKERYDREVNVYLAGRSNGWWVVDELGGADALRELLQGDAKSETSRHGTNHWRSCLLRALAEHDAFCEGGFKEAFPQQRTDGA
jgi:hypothetical protein